MGKQKEIEKTEFYVGEVQGFSGSWGSGIATLVINGRGVFCENAPIIRALEGCFGDIIQEGHCASVENIIGERIVFSVDFMGILEGFTPENEFFDSIFDDETMEIVEY